MVTRVERNKGKHRIDMCRETYIDIKNITNLTFGDKIKIKMASLRAQPVKIEPENQNSLLSKDINQFPAASWRGMASLN